MKNSELAEAQMTRAQVFELSGWQWAGEAVIQNGAGTESVPTRLMEPAATA
jgi:hypothetical protein